MPPGKRRRVGDDAWPAGGPTAPPSDPIELLSSESIKSLLRQAAKDHPSVAASINDLVAAQRKEEATKVHDFDHYSKEAWFKLNKEFRNKTPRQQFDILGMCRTTLRSCSIPCLH